MHEDFCKKNPNKRIWSAPGHSSWCKGLTKETDPRLKKVSASMHQAYLEGRNTGRGATKEKEERRRAKIRLSKNIGGYRIGSGRGKKGWYKGIFCDSSWELAFVLYRIEIKKLSIKKNWERFPYKTSDAVVHYYVPDFIIGSGVYVEVKGYVTETVLLKLRQFPHRIRLLTAKEMAPILRAVVARFGKDYIRLYGEVAEHG